MHVISLLEKQDQKGFWLNRMLIVSTSGNQDKCTAFKTFNSLFCLYGKKYFVWHDFHTRFVLVFNISIKVTTTYFI